MDGSATHLVLSLPGTLPAAVSEEAFQLQLLERLPLAQAILLLLGHILSEPLLEGIYEEHRGRCYQRQLSFPDMVHLMRDALVLHNGSGRGSFQKAQTKQDLPSSIRAVYGKLGRMPLAVSRALLGESVPRLLELMPTGPAPAASSLNHLRRIAIDGKTIKHVARKLKILRHRRGRINSGKILAALDLRSGLALAIHPSRNSEANDVSLVDGLMEQLPANPQQPRLFIADRQFCDLPRLLLFSQGADHFLIRHNRSIYFHPEESRPVRQGVDREGRTFIEQWGWLGDEKHELRRYVRRITLLRPGEENVEVVTDLLDAAAYPAQDLLDAYLERWGIERVFQQVTEVFDLRHLIGCDPRATLFQAAFCMVLYNVTQVVRTYVAVGQQRKVAEVSTEKLFEDCQGELIAWAKVGDVQVTIRVLGQPASVPSKRQMLEHLLGGLWKQSWLKARPQPRRNKTKQTIYPRKGYTNVGKLQDELADAARRAKRRTANRKRRASK